MAIEEEAKAYQEKLDLIAERDSLRKQVAKLERELKDWKNEAAIRGAACGDYARSSRQVVAQADLILKANLDLQKKAMASEKAARRARGAMRAVKRYLGEMPPGLLAKFLDVANGR